MLNQVGLDGAIAYNKWASSSFDLQEFYSFKIVPRGAPS